MSSFCAQCELEDLSIIFALETFTKCLGINFDLKKKGYVFLQAWMFSVQGFSVILQKALLLFLLVSIH